MNVTSNEILLLYYKVCKFLDLLIQLVMRCIYSPNTRCHLIKDTQTETETPPPVNWFHYTFHILLLHTGALFNLETCRLRCIKNRFAASKQASPLTFVRELPAHLSPLNHTRTRLYHTLHINVLWRVCC